MRWAILGICALSLGGVGTARAQFTTPGTPVGTPLSLGNAGAPNAKPVGSPAGAQVGSAPGGVPQSTSQDFSKIDKSRLAAPLPNYPGIGGEPTLWDRTMQRVVAAVHYINPFSTTTQPRPNWVPGISRRNRERSEERMFRRD